MKKQMALKHPPSTNRGVRNTTPLPHLEALIDWCAFTVSDQESFARVSELFGIGPEEFLQMPKGGFGYKSQVRCGNISIYSDGKPDMGIHVEMTGQGCRQFESRSGKWRELISRVFEVGGHFTRVDVAIDDREGYFSLLEVREKMERRELRSRFKEGRDTTSFSFSDESRRDGKTLYFGSTKSDAKIRIYDKAVEQGVDGLWIRTELECRRERANILARYLADSEDVGAIVAGVLKNYLAFVDPSTDSNKARWSISPWWEKFLGSVERLKLAMKKAERTIEQVREWFEKQAAPSLALLLKFEGGDLDYLVKLSSDGEKRLKPKHLAMLQGFC